MPDIISRMCDASRMKEITNEQFDEIMRFLLDFIKKDKQCESLVEKLCQRMANVE
jgi:condensin complex subunit 1